MSGSSQSVFSFATGRPKELIFQTVSTDGLPPDQRYELWAEEVLRSYSAAPADACQRRDFNGRATSLADPSGEIHHAVADGYEVHRSAHGTQDNNHDELALFLMLDGEASVAYQDGALQRIKTGEFFILDGTCTTRLSWTRHAAIQVDLSRFRLEAEFAGSLPAPERLNTALARSPLTGFLRNHLIEFSTLSARLSAAELRTLLETSEFLAIATIGGAVNAQAKDTQKSQQGLFAEAQRIMHRQLDDPGLDVAAIALQLGCSRASLYRAFATQQLSVAECLRTLRLRNAYRLLQQAPAHHTIAELAARCGFIDSASFSRLFRQYYGVRPSDVRSKEHHTQQRRGLRVSETFCISS